MAGYGGKRPGAGRKVGSKGKQTLAAREAMEAAFKGLGGVQALQEWAQENPSDFYRIWSRLVPQAQSIAVSDGEGGPLVIRIVDESRKRG